MTVFKQNIDNKSFIIGLVCMAVACGLPVIGDIFDKVFTMVRDTVKGLFKNFNIGSK